MKILKLSLLLSILFIYSCSEEKKLQRVFKKHDARDIAVYLVKNYPEYLRSDTVRYETTIHDTIRVAIPELDKDTIIPIEPNANTGVFNYDDRNISITIKEENDKYKISYVIKKKSVKAVWTKQVKVNVPCPPCPQIGIINALKDDYNKKYIKYQDDINNALKEKWYQKIYRIGFWVLFLLTLVLVLIRFVIPRLPKKGGL